MQDRQKPLFSRSSKVDAFLEIGLNFRYDMSLSTPVSVKIFTTLIVLHPRFKDDAVYGFLSRLKTGIAKDEQVAGGL